MIYIRNIRNVRPQDYDQCWAIVRSLKSPSPWMTHVQELSPSLDLFWWYCREKKAGAFTQEKFDQEYTPRFTAQIRKDEAAQHRLDELVRLDAEGKKIALFCFCPNPAQCHRTIIGKMLEERGANVSFG